MMRPHIPGHSSWPKFLAWALFVAVICNGASFYLKRIGVLDNEAYRDYWAIHCAAKSRLPTPQTEPQCSTLVSANDIARYAVRPLEQVTAASIQYVYDASLAERLLKLVKDLFWVVLIGTCCWRIATDRSGRSTVRHLWLLGLFGAYSIGAFLVSIPLNGVLIATAGLRSFLFLFLALLGQWLVPHLPVFARCVAALIVLQAIAMPLELVLGIHLFREWSTLSLASRTAGTLVQPNSMGVFAAAAVTFYFCFAPSRRWLWLLAVAALALVLLSGSGTGLLCLAVGLWAALVQSPNPRRRVIAKFAGWPILALVVFMLPDLSGRQNIFESVWFSGTRLSSLQAALFERPLDAVIFGEGLGVNTNLALNLSPGRALVPTDSALTGLLIQIGVVGTLLFYATLLWAAVRDRRARPFYATAALASLTINLNELFPVNLLLGLAWAHSAWASGRASTTEAGLHD